MKKYPIALQLYSVRDFLQNDFEGTLKKVKAMGYDGVEFAGLYGKSGAEVRALCQEIGLIPISAHVTFTDMINDIEILKTYREIGCEYVVIPYVNPEHRSGGDKFGELIESAKKIGAKANELGMKLAYHNHDFEFEKINGEYALDVLYKEVPANLLQTELDTCWVNVGGENPADYIRKYNGRCEIVHLKDFVGQKSENMYSLIGIKDDGKKAGKQCFAFRHLGAGVQNFPEILAACDECDVRWLVIEQDVPTEGLTSLECAEKSLQYLKSL